MLHRLLPGPRRWVTPYVVGVALLVGCGGDGDAGSVTESTAASSTSSVPSRYEELCPGRAVHVAYLAFGGALSVSYTAEMADGVSQGEADLPLKNKTGSAGLQFCQDPDAFLYFSAQNMGASGSVTCAVEVDGERVSSVSSSGAYVIATCSP